MNTVRPQKPWTGRFWCGFLHLNHPSVPIHSLNANLSLNF